LFTAKEIIIKHVFQNIISYHTFYYCCYYWFRITSHWCKTNRRCWSKSSVTRQSSNSSLRIAFTHLMNYVHTARQSASPIRFSSASLAPFRSIQFRPVGNAASRETWLRSGCLIWHAVEDEMRCPEGRYDMRPSLQFQRCVYSLGSTFNWKRYDH